MGPRRAVELTMGPRRMAVELEPMRAVLVVGKTTGSWVHLGEVRRSEQLECTRMALVPRSWMKPAEENV